MAEISIGNLLKLIATAEYGSDSEEALLDISPLYLSFAAASLDRVLSLAADTVTYKCADGSALEIDLNNDGQVIGIEFL